MTELHLEIARLRKELEYAKEKLNHAKTDAQIRQAHHEFKAKQAELETLIQQQKQKRGITCNR